VTLILNKLYKIKKKFNSSKNSLFSRDGNMVKILIDYSKCTGNREKLCVEICPVSVFREEKHGKLVVVNEENCILCRTCQFNCPKQAIEVLT